MLLAASVWSTTYQSAVGAGNPPPLSVKVVGSPTQRLTLVGLSEPPSRNWTLSMAGLVVTIPVALVNTARYCLKLSDFRPSITRLGPVAPATSAKVAPPSLDICHCCCGGGEPAASAVKAAVPPPSGSTTSWGCIVTVGAESASLSVAALLRTRP